MGRCCSKRNCGPHIGIRKRREIGEYLGCRRAFSQAGKHSPQRHSCALEHRFAANDLRVADDPGEIVNRILIVALGR